MTARGNPIIHSGDAGEPEVDLTKDEFVVQLEKGAQNSAGLPVTSAVLRWTAAQLRGGEPPWWLRLSDAWAKRRFVVISEAWTLYLAALHFAALEDPHCPLAACFPSCGGNSTADVGAALAKFFAAAPPSFWQNLREGQRRNYAALRSTLWISPALLFFQRMRGLPFYLVEANAGAGLNLVADLLFPQEVFDSRLLEARVALDNPPLNAADARDRRWLTAAMMPDHLKSLNQLSAACVLVEKRVQGDADFIQHAPCPAEGAAAFVAESIPAADASAGLLFMNMGVTTRMSDQEYAAYSHAVEAMLKPWGNRGLWVEVEGLRADPNSITHQMRAHRIVNGQLRSFVMAQYDLRTMKPLYSPASADFLKI